MRRAFQLFDTDRSGDIDSAELRKALQHLGMEADSAQTREVMRKYDISGRGKLGLSEFNKLVRELLEFQKGAQTSLAAKPASPSSSAPGTVQGPLCTGAASAGRCPPPLSLKADAPPGGGLSPWLPQASGSALCTRSRSWPPPPLRADRPQASPPPRAR